MRLLSAQVRWSSAQIRLRSAQLRHHLAFMHSSSDATLQLSSPARRAASFQPGPLMAVYYATKACVLSFSEAIADELRDAGVTVTALCPGPAAAGFASAANMEASRLFKMSQPARSSEVARAGYEAMKRPPDWLGPGLRFSEAAKPTEGLTLSLQTPRMEGLTLSLQTPRMRIRCPGFAAVSSGAVC